MVLSRIRTYFFSKSAPPRNLQNDINQNYGAILELKTTEENLKGYNKNIVSIFSQYLKPKSGEMLVDFGAGTGALSDIWVENFGITPLCVEVDPLLTKILKKKGYKTFTSINEIDSRVDGVFSSNVLEHIDDDLNSLAEIRNSLKQGGKLILYVPAFQILYSQLDRNVGHFRRYSRRELVEKLESSGFIVEKCNYSDSLGFFATLIVKLLRFHKNGVLCSSSSLKIYDFLFYPLSRLLDSIGLKSIFGKNLIAFASVPFTREKVD